MGWSGTEGEMWGDEPQVVIDDAIRRIDRKFDSELTPKDERMTIARKLRNDKLWIRLDKIYKRELKRSMTVWEFDNLIKVGTNTGGRTVLWNAK